MPTRAATKPRRSICVKPQHKDGYRTGDRYSRAAGQIHPTGDRCERVMSNCEMYDTTSLTPSTILRVMISPAKPWLASVRIKKLSREAETLTWHHGPPPQELAQITDEMIYNELQVSDISLGRWTAEDPSVRAVQRWRRLRPRTT